METRFHSREKGAPGCVPRRESVSRSALLVFCAIWSVAPTLRAQRNPELDQRFRKASEAMRAGNLSAAGEGFAGITKDAPTFAEAHLNLGLVREEQGRHEEAIASFQKALLLNPKLRGASLFLGIAEYRLNRFDEAAPILRKETAASPKDANAWMWLGVVELARQHAEEAADALDKAAKLAPNDVDILYHRGQAHLQVSKNSYEKMFKQDPKSWRVHQVMAQTATEAERYDDAIVEYLAAIKLAPTQPGLHEELGSAYHSAAKIEDAEAAYRRELEIDPHNALAKYKLGVLSMEKGDGPQAKELIEAALREKPGLENSEYNLGRTEMLLENNGAAAEHFQRATKNSSDPEAMRQAWYQLGIVYRKMHRMDDARQAMDVFQKLKDSEEEDARRAKLKRAQQNSDAGAPPPAPQNPQ
jgi:tetratricopeptide (TPR) repeat protein